jgi:beta-galactosidase/beta-glucuronidase
MTLPVKGARLWTPEDPHLYQLEARLKLGSRTIDRVESYFGMRKISLGKDERGFTRMLLNNKPYFQFGPLDQGFWPDGIYTAPTDQALRSDIEMTKKLGFNMARKHVKVEPDRWYYWCDKLGLLVWQDMPSGDKYIGPKDPDIERSAESADEFEKELRALIDGRGQHPCIVMWVPYNEGWGQWNTPQVVDNIRRLDPTRLVDNTSGWSDRGVGDVNDMHKYPGPGSPESEEKRAVVLGEFGGLGLPIHGHTWQSEKNWGYRSYTNSEVLTSAYVDLTKKLFPLIEEKGLSAAVYTQTTDVEIEVNGLMTYDREIVKMDLKKIAEANRGCYTKKSK